MKKLLLMVAAVVSVGCVTGPIFDIVRNNNANMATLSVGMTKTQVLAIMGPAGKTEAYETKTGGILEFLIYRTETPLADLEGDFAPDSLGYIPPVVTDRHWTPICIIDGKLKGWGRNFYDDTIKIRKELIKNP